MDDFDAFIKEVEAQPSETVGEVLVFVDECHRTQSGKAEPRNELLELCGCGGAVVRY